MITNYLFFELSLAKYHFVIQEIFKLKVKYDNKKIKYFARLFKSPFEAQFISVLWRLIIEKTTLFAIGKQ
jgi:hypothetical protein